MSAASDRETFDVACDWSADRARVALVGSEGTEILVILPFSAPHAADRAEAKQLIYKEGEARLRAALLTMIGTNWPSEG